MVSFQTIPSTLRVPGAYFEVSAVNANTGQVQQNTLLIGQKLAAGTAPANIPVLASGVANVNLLLGVGSMLANMYATYTGVIGGDGGDPLGTVWLLPLADAGAAVAATGSIIFSGTVSATSVLSLYIAGNLVPVMLTSGSASTAVATAVAAAINLVTFLPVTATVSTSTVLLTSKNLGPIGNDVDLRVNLIGFPAGEITPPGLTVLYLPMSGGVLNPVLTTGLSNLAMPYDFIAMPYTDATSLNALQAFMSDATGTWSYLSGANFGGGAFSAYKGLTLSTALSDCVTFGTGRNDQHMSILAVKSSPSPAYIIAAAYTAAAAASLRIDPAVPLGGVGDGVTLNFVPDIVANRFIFTERQTLLFSGMSTYVVEQGGRVRVEAAQTTYQKNAADSIDNSYLSVNIPYTLMFLIRALKADLSSKFARMKLVQDGTRISFGSNMVSPQIITNEVIAFTAVQAAAGLVTDVATFNTLVYSTIQGNSTVAVYCPWTLAGQLEVIEVLVQFTNT